MQDVEEGELAFTTQTAETAMTVKTVVGACLSCAFYD